MTPKPVEIKRLTYSEHTLLDRVAAEVFDKPIDPKRRYAYLTQPGHYMLVGISEGEVVAQVAAVIHRHPDKPTEFYIDEVAVAPAFRQQGLARKMLEEMFALGKSLGCEEAWVGTEHDNLPARRLYETHGKTEAEPFVMYVYEL